MGLVGLAYGIVGGGGLFLVLFVDAFIVEVFPAFPTDVAGIVYGVALSLAMLGVLAGALPLLIGGALSLAGKKSGRVVSLIGTELYLVAGFGHILVYTWLFYFNWGFSWRATDWSDVSTVGAVLGISVGVVLTGVFIVRRLVSKKGFSQEKRSAIRLLHIYKGACEDRVLSTGYGLQSFAEVLNCPTCKFADQAARKQGMPWCESPNQPDIEKDYCSTFESKGGDQLAD